MAALSTVAREHIAGLLDKSIVAARYPLPSPLRRFKRDMPLAELGEESIFRDRPFQILPVSGSVTGTTLHDIDKDENFVWRLSVGFLLGGTMDEAVAEMEEWDYRIRRLLNTSVNWNTPDTGIERCILSAWEYLYAPAPDRRGLLRTTLEVRIAENWAVDP